MSAPTNPKNLEQFKQALKESEAWRQLLLDSSLDSIICTDEAAHITDFNAASERLFRISRSDVVGKDLTKAILPPGVRDAHRNELFAPLSNSGLELIGNRIETVAVRADGNEFPAELTVSRIRLENKSSFVVHIRDLSARRRAEEALVWLAAIVESSQDAIIGKDLDGRIMSWNRGAELMYEYSAADAIGKSISMLAPPERADEIPAILNELRCGRRVTSLETVRVAKSGRRLDVSLTISPVRDPQGKLTGASVVARDITESKRAQAALRRANETSIYSSPIAIIAADANRRITLWNGAASETFGWNESEVIGKPVCIIPAEESENALRLHKRLMAGEIVKNVEVRRQKKDGTLLTMSLSATPLWDEHHQVKGIIAFLLDITDRKNAEEAWRHAEEKYRTIFENAIEGIYQATPEGKYISANPALARIFGFDSPQELIAARNDISRQEYIRPELRAAFMASIEQKGIVQNFEYEAYRRDGKKIWISASARPVRDANGNILYYEGTVQDVTEQRTLEQQIRQMQKIEAIGRLAGGVAHDFNNILMAISSYAELLNRKSPDDGSRRYIGEISHAVGRGSTLTQSLLAFSRKQVASPRVVDLNKLIAAQLDMLRRLVPENVELQFSPGSGNKFVRVDPSQIDQVVMNLVINSRDAMPQGGKVFIKTEWVVGSPDQWAEAAADAKFVVLSVSDTGCGMDSETQSHIFEPFFTTKEPGKGTGLGLATVFGIVKQSRGFIALESEVGHGTTFKIHLPEAQEVASQPQKEEPVVSVQGSETILLVEDEVSVREPAAQFLRDNGYSVLVAANGIEALEIAKAHTKPIHLLLSDLVMPRMSGRELSEEMARVHPEAKVIFMSGYSRNVLANPQELDPGWILLQKPFHLNVLGQCIRRTLDKEIALRRAAR